MSVNEHKLKSPTSDWLKESSALKPTNHLKENFVLTQRWGRGGRSYNLGPNVLVNAQKKIFIIIGPDFLE